MLQFPRWRVDATVGGDLVKTFYETATTSAAAIGKAKHKMRGAVSSAGAFKFKATKAEGGESGRHHATKKSPAQLQREIDEALTRSPVALTTGATSKLRRELVRELLARGEESSAQYAEGLDDAEIVELVRGRGNSFRDLTEMADAIEATDDARSHATMKSPTKGGMHPHAKGQPGRGPSGGRTYLSVEGVGHRLRHGYEIHWNWIARRDGVKIDGGALTGGDLPEFYTTWPDSAGIKAILTQMKKIVREWIQSGEFGVRKLSPKVAISLRKSSRETPIR